MSRQDRKQVATAGGSRRPVTTETAWQSLLQGAKELIKTLGPAILIALVVRSSVVQAFWVPSGSMKPTIQIGDHIFVNKLAYTVRMPLIDTPLTDIQSPERGDIVVFVRPGDPKTDLIKRVIAVAGDTVEIKRKKLFINGVAVPDSHAHFEDPLSNLPRDNMRPRKVPPRQFFVMGDNRDRSYDSRFWGFANIEAIKGRATFVYWSRDSQSCWKELRRKGLSEVFSPTCLPRWRRFGIHIQ